MTKPTRPVRRQKCVDCGTIIRARGTRCRICQAAAFRRTDEIALTGGEWVVRNGVRYWTGPRPSDPPEFRGDVLETFGRTLKAGQARIAHEDDEPTFCACGCWLLNASEDCPACMVRVEWLPWAVKAEARHNRATFGRAA